MLEYDVHAPEDPRPDAPLLVLLHGRGADRADLAPLRPLLPADHVLVLPQAPHEAAPWGYGPGWAWYRYEGGDRPGLESFEESQEALDGFLPGLRGKLGLQDGPVVLGGFSQGGTTALGYALRHPGELAAVLVFSGFLPVHPQVSVDRESVLETPIFWAHGNDDPNIPIAIARRGWEVLHSAGAEVTTRGYPIGHWIDPGEMREAVEWLDHRL